jgi:hypothetical protein
MTACTPCDRATAADVFVLSQIGLDCTLVRRPNDMMVIEVHSNITANEGDMPNFESTTENLMDKPQPSTNISSLLTGGAHCARRRGISKGGSHARDQV